MQEDLTHVPQIDGVHLPPRSVAKCIPGELFARACVEVPLPGRLAIQAQAADSQCGRSEVHDILQQPMGVLRQAVFWHPHWSRRQVGLATKRWDSCPTSPSYHEGCSEPQQP